ncbi:MAG: DUF1761 domain-containing protein [Candidatus Andersenbacteria bacterium]
MTILLILLFSIIGAVISAVVGTLWYSNNTPMGRIHMQYLGMDKLSEEEKKASMEKGKAMMPKMYAGQLLLSLLTSFAVVYIVAISIQNQLPFLLALGFVVFNWLTFMVPIIGQGVLWGNVDRKIAWKKFFSDSASNLVSILIIAYLTSLFA